LSTKLFCGYCKSAMTGVSGKGKMGKKYFYYQCVTNRKDKSARKEPSIRVTLRSWSLQRHANY